MQTQGPPDNTVQVQSTPSSEIPGPDPQGTPDIFDERFDMFMAGFGETCANNQVELALAVVVDPLCPERPVVFARGDSYKLAKLARMITEQLRDQAIRELY